MTDLIVIYYHLRFVQNKYSNKSYERFGIKYEVGLDLDVFLVQAVNISMSIKTRKYTKLALLYSAIANSNLYLAMKRSYLVVNKE